MKIEFYKYQGTGNDFLMLDNRNSQVPDLSHKQIKVLCNRRFGVGADGLILLCNQPGGYDFKMVYYNADGHESSMCGNGGRCIVKFAHQVGLHKSKYRFMAIDGPHEAEIDREDLVRLKMQNVSNVEHRNSHFIVNTGSPHFVKFADNVKEIDVFETGREIRFSKEFEKDGININFVESTGEDSIFVRTYERGVEDETHSCGTGVTAAALLSAHNEFGFNRVEVKTPGGHLSVEYDKVDESHFENIWLCGPAEFVYKGVIEIESD